MSHEVHDVTAVTIDMTNDRRRRGLVLDSRDGATTRSRSARRRVRRKSLAFRLTAETAPQYTDRHEAGRLLAGTLRRYRGEPNLVALGLPRGGIPVAYEVATLLDAPLDVFDVRQLGMPGHRARTVVTRLSRRRRDVSVGAAA